MSKVFISYSSEDSPFVDQLVKDLEQRTVGVWYAKYEIKVGDSIVAKINEGLTTTDWLLLVMSQSAVKSPWVQLELNAAVALTVQRGAYILVARIDSAPIPPILLDRKYADFSKDKERGLNELLAVIWPVAVHLPDPASQIAWAQMSVIFKGMLSGKTSNPSSKRELLADTFDGIKGDWHMGDEVYDLYIQACMDAGRLLHPVEFIELIPTFDVNDPRMHAAFRFLMENMVRGARSENG